MKPIQKISILVSVQIIIIIISFFTLIIIESEKTNLGHSVNISGKNRFLAESLQLDLFKYTVGSSSEQQVLESKQKLEQNIMLLKNGGKVNDLNFPPLSSIFVNELTDLENKLQVYVINIEKILEENGKLHGDLEISQQELIISADNLTNLISIHSFNVTNELIVLEMFLGAINIGTHIFLIYIILRIFNKYSDEKNFMEKMKTIGELSSRLAHDLRNPLTIILGDIELLKLKENNLNEQELKSYERIERAIKKMDFQINDILTYVKSRPLKKQKHSLKQVIHEALDFIPKYENVRFNLPEEELFVNCDKDSISAVFTNLIINSIQAMDYKGEINIRFKDSSSHVIIEIEDSGPGISVKPLSKIFESMYTSKQDGTGLGLLICKNNVEQHGGSIDVQINPTIFKVVLPKT